MHDVHGSFTVERGHPGATCLRPVSRDLVALDDVMKWFPLSSRATYRPDIDGLRAIAVCAVVAFHAFPNLAPGGFAGVDVFFVISGFLISQLMLGDLRAGQLSLRRF